MPDMQTAKQSYLWEYLTMTGKLWGNHIAGPVLAVITIALTIAAALVTGDTTTAAKLVKWSAWLTGAATVFLMFVAQFDAWHAKQVQLELEQAKNGKPDIQGIAENFTVEPPRTDLVGADHKETRFGVRLRISACNYRPIKTNITHVVLDGRNLSRPIEFREINFPSSIGDFEYAIGKEFPVSAIAIIKGVVSRDLYASAIHLDNLIVGLVDGLGDTHLLQISPAEGLWFSSPADGA